MIEAEQLSKRYGSKQAVSDVTFQVKPGQVTGFLGPNGAGKSTTMRMLVGLDKPSAGTATINGKNYREMQAPLREVGVLLDAKAVHTGRTARNHLRAMAATHGIPNSRVDEVIGLTGLEAVANKRAGGFSLGMGQRLGIAAALLGDPQTLILDEPVNGLDPEGVRWVRQFVKHYAAQGRTVLLSSHLMSEMAVTADHIIVLGKGRVLANSSTQELVNSWTNTSIQLQSPRLSELLDVIQKPDLRVTQTTADVAQIQGVTAAEIGDIAAVRGIPIHGLSTQSGSLEEAYMALTGDSVEYQSKEL